MKIESQEFIVSDHINLLKALRVFDKNEKRHSFHGRKLEGDQSGKWLA